MSKLEIQATSASYAPARTLQIESEGNAFGIELKKAQAEAYIPSRNETNVRSQPHLPAAAQEHIKEMAREGRYPSALQA
ncbi:hypothetical protein [Dickeya dadantii]|uniref:hypothetical protein n=1 Tax=Dickeya dadantii TaxID=204038 RepID=UPI00057699BD|nr:hypothetical protein [Dickeya dadantii]